MGLKGKKIVLGVTGGIAVYKACEIVRLFVQKKAKVHVVMTQGATRFVTPLTFQALSQHPVHFDLFDLTQESQMGHIQLADTADGVLIAPATANFIAKTAHGICDDLLTTLLCVTRAPVVVAPAMNVHMWKNKILQRNVQTLKEVGYTFIEPAKGSLACGYEGEGRLPEPSMIVSQVESLFKK